MKLHHWYVQRFSDQDLYFYGLSVQKNGGLAGVLVDTYHDRPRKKPKATFDSVPVSYATLWKPIDTLNVPERVLLATQEKLEKVR